MNNSNLHNEREIVFQISEGNERAFLALYKHFYAQLKPIVQKYLNSGIEPEEILQQSFLKVWLNREKLPEVENLQAWIYKIAYREYLIALRKRLNYEDKLNKYSLTLDEGNSQALPHDIVNLENIRERIQEVVNDLAPQRKAIYELSRNEGLRINEIAEKLSIAPQTVKNVLFTVLKMIREHLMKNGYGPVSLIIFFNYLII